MRKKKKMRKWFKDSVKALEADIQLANTLLRRSLPPDEIIIQPGSTTLAISCAVDYLVGSLGLLKVLIYKAYIDGKTTMSIQERKGSIQEFYGQL